MEERRWEGREKEERERKEGEKGIRKKEGGREFKGEKRDKGTIKEM